MGELDQPRKALPVISEFERGASGLGMTTPFLLPGGLTRRIREAGTQLRLLFCLLRELRPGICRAKLLVGAFPEAPSSG